MTVVLESGPGPKPSFLTRSLGAIPLPLPGVSGLPLPNSSRATPFPLSAVGRFSPGPHSKQSSLVILQDLEPKPPRCGRCGWHLPVGLFRPMALMAPRISDQTLEPPWYILGTFAAKVSCLSASSSGGVTFGCNDGRRFQHWTASLGEQTWAHLAQPAVDAANVRSMNARLAVDGWMTGMSISN